MIRKKWTAVIITVMMAMAAVPALAWMTTVHAGSSTDIAMITGGERFDSLAALNTALEKYENKTVEITMLSDWNAAKDDMFDRQLSIPEKCKATLDMGGHVFNRNNAWDKGDDCYDGELIYMHEDAKLTINGGPQYVEHKQVPVHTSTTKDGLATGRATFYGGLLCGGASDDGPGGIYMDSDCTLILNDVTIAGCRAHKGAFATEDGDGGAIQLDGADQKVVMNNSRITGCLASDRGGAIYADYTSTLYCTDVIEMNNSSIDHNYSTNNGGGIFLNLDNTKVTGNGDSSISFNESGGSGGGIYINDEDIAIAGFTLEGNKAKKNGGAICVENTDIGLTNLKVKDNSAEFGGGFYLNRQKLSMGACELTGNEASKSGGGVYLGENVHEKIFVSGKTIVRGNSAGWGANFYMSDDDPEDNRVRFNLASGSDVRVYYAETKSKDRIMVTEGKTADTIKSPDCTRSLTSENKGYYFAFLPEASNRKIVLKKGTQPQPRTSVRLSADTITSINKENPSKDRDRDYAGPVSAGGEAGYGYDLYKLYFTHQKTDSATGEEDRHGAFYYSDAFFYGKNDPDPQYKYNEHLATTSLALAYSAMYTARSADSIGGNTYYNKHAAGRQFLADIGCNEQYIYVNDSNVRKPETDSIGVIIGKKNLQKYDSSNNLADTGDILIPVAVRGGGYEKEWASNVTVGTAEQTAGRGKEHQGFSDAAEQVTKEVNQYLDRYHLRDDYEQGNVKFWVVGYSRAGATANLTSKRLVEQIERDCKGAKKSQVFGYTCEAPKGGTDEAEKVSAAKYYCIHNLINTADVVPYVPPENMGFKRYGVDHYIPGSAAGNVTVKEKTVKRGGKNGVTKVTTRCDNTAMRTKGAKENDSECQAYNKQRNKMVEQLSMIDDEIVFDDYFHPMWIDMPKMEFKETGSYDNTRVEDFLDDFIRFFMEGLEPDNMDHWSQAVCTRDRWLEPWGMNGKFYNPIQTALRDFMCLAFGKSSKEFGTFTSRAMTIMDTIPVILHSGVTQFQIYTDVIGDWHELSPADKDKWCTYFWDKLEDAGALDILTAEEKTQLKNDWPTTLGFLLHMVDGDYQYSNSSYNKNAKNATWMSGSKETMMYLGTFVTFSSYIMSNHYPEVNLAWARTYDYYYSGGYDGNHSGETSGYFINSPRHVAPPAAYIETEETIDGETHKVAKELEKTGAGNVNSLKGDQRIYLDNSGIRGEAIYYDLCEMKSNGKEGADFEYNQIYRGGIDLSLEGAKAKTYRLKVYDMSYGVASDKAIYDIELSSADSHIVTVISRDENNSEHRTKYEYKTGETVTLAAGQSANIYFVNWKVERIDVNGNKVDVTDDLLGDEKASASTEFKMPEVGAEYPEGYDLECTANYEDRVWKITSLTFYQDKPEPGQKLIQPASIFFNEESGSNYHDYPIHWKYEYTDPQTQKTQTGQADSGVFYNDTVYTAIITMPEDKAAGIVFPPADKLEEVNFIDVRPDTISVSRNDADGSLTVQIRFDKTESGDLHPPVPSVTVKPWDTNTGAYIEGAETAYPQAATVRMTAPEIPAEVFSKWDLKNTGITLAEGYELTEKTIEVTIPDGSPEMIEIDAQYIPVISEITVNLAQPEGGKPLQTEAEEWTVDKPGTLKVKIEKEYEVHPDFVKIEWYPNHTRATYLNNYRASVTLAPKGDESGKYITVREAGTQGEYTRINAEYIFAEQPVVTMNGAAAGFYPDLNLVKYVFPMTKYRFDHFEELSDITDLKYGSGESAIRKRLPDFVVCVPTNGSTWRGKVSWEVVKDDPDADPRAAGTWTATGSVELPEAMENPDNIPMTVTVKAYVNGADYAEAPRASLDSGTYLTDQSATLTTNEKDGTIYYAVTGDVPPAEEAEYAAWEKTLTWEEYTGQSIAIDRADATPDEDGVRRITLKAYTAKEDKWESAVCTYTYTFDNEIPVPAGKELTYNAKEQTGIPSSPFYTIESETEGWTIPEGKAVAVNAGDYTARLHLADPNYKWVVPKEDEESANASEKQTTTDDQIVSFVIHSIPIRYASISGIENKTITFDSETQQYIPVTQEPEITIELSGKKTTLVEGTDYELSYENNDKPTTEDEKATVIISGKGNYSATASFSFEISVGAETTHKVVVNNGSQTRSFRYLEGDAVTVLANPEPDTYFRNWTVKLLNKDGETEEDIAEALLGESKDKVSATFTMPAEGDDISDSLFSFAKYPEGYSLVISANCPDRIKAISASVTAPKAGIELLPQAGASFDGAVEEKGPFSISWTYSYEEDGKIITVPTAAEAYNDTVYTATVTIPQDQSDGIVFAPTESLTGNCDTGTVKSVSRNDADGSASIVIEFPKTEKSGGTVRPDVNISLTVMAKDMNIAAEGYDGTAAAEYQVRQDDTITLTAPDVANEQFIGWDFGASGINLVSGYAETNKTIQAKVPAGLSGDPLKIYAQYVPVISEINVSLRAPVANEAVQTAAEAGTLKVKISNQYEIDPDCVEIAWTPQPGAGGQAAYLTAYTAIVSLKTHEDEAGEYIKAKGPEDTGYDTRLAAQFRYADNLVAKVNGYMAVCDETANSVSYTFPKTEAEPIETRHKVTVIDGAQTSVHQYDAGEVVTVVANAPADKYFRKWTVSLLNSEGAVIEEDPQLPGVDGKAFEPQQQAASFTMPEVGRDFPEAYSLQFTAVYADRIKEVSTSVTAPKAGTELLPRTGASFDGAAEETGPYSISWTYAYEKDGETVVVPASGEAYRDTVYTATIIMPQDKDSGILFAPTGSLEGICDTGTVKSIERNDADGSAKLVIEFEKTGKNGPLRPEADIALTIRTYDLNKKAQISEEEIYVLQNTSITLTAPDVPNEQFVKWDFKHTGIAPEEGYGVKDKLIHVRIPADLSEDAVEVFAQYQPVVSEIRVDLEEPVSGEAMQTAADDNTLKVTVANQYAIDPAFVVIAWTPEPLTEDDVKKAAAKTSYTAEVTIRTKKDADGEYVMAKGPGDEGYATRLAAKFVYADNLRAFVNGELAVCDTEENSVSCTFPPTEGDPEPVIRTHQVTVDNGSGADPRKYTYQENEIVTVVANPSADRYFKTWSVKLLDQDGDTAKEDIAEELLGGSAASTTAKFVLPEEGSDIESGLTGLFSGSYPEGYSLKITANCADRIKQVNASPAAPAAGETLAANVDVSFDNGAEKQSFPIKWTYHYEKGGKTITEPASGKAFSSTAYTATVKVPQDWAKDILFAEELSLNTSYGEGVVTGSSVTRNGADGSANIVIDFAPTAAEGGPVRPDIPIQLTVRVKDLNTGAYDDGAAVTCQVQRNPDQDTVFTLNAPEVANEQFRQWNFGASGVTLAEGYETDQKIVQAIIPEDVSVTATSIKIEAQYVPVISKIAARLAPPVGGQPLQTAADEDTLKVKISNTYEVKPACVSIAWSPRPAEGNAAYQTAYTATLTIQPEEGKDYIEVRKTGETEYQKVTASFVYAANVKTTVNGETAVCNTENGSISYTFPATDAQPGPETHTVTVHDGDKVSVDQYPEEALVTILAKQPSDQYFKNWTVKLLHETGAVVADDIAETLLEDNADKTAVSFTMPKAGDDEYSVGNRYPDGFALDISAVYGDRIKTVTTTPAAPLSGDLLAEEAELTFDGDAAGLPYPISWAYTYEKDGKTIVVPASGEAYRDTAYTATINIPQSRVDGIMFADEITLVSDYDEGVIVGSSVTKNNSDGSVTIVIDYAKTAADAGPLRPDVPVEFTVNVKDLNLGTYDDSAAEIYHLKRDGQDTIITLTAPDVASEKFVNWDLGDDGIKLGEGYKLTDKTIQIIIPKGVSKTAARLAVEAQYIPIVNRISIVLDEPVAGQDLQTDADDTTLQVKIQNQYQIDPKFIKINWSPDPEETEGHKKAASGTVYTATVSVEQKEDADGKYIKAKGPEDTDYRRIAAQFTYAENLKATVNDKTAVCDTEAGSVSCTFAKTDASHTVTVIDGDHSKSTKYSEGAQASISASEPADKFFKNWSIALLDGDGKLIAEDIAESLLGAAVSVPSANFTIPEAGTPVTEDAAGQKYPNAFALECTANYIDRIKQVTASPDAPETGAELAEKAYVSFDNGALGKKCLISWTYVNKSGGDPIAVDVNARAAAETVYTATINVPADPENNILFADSESLKGICETGTVKSIARNDADGSVTIVIEFEKTGPESSDEGDDPVIDLIKKITVSVDAPVTGLELDEKAKILFDNGTPAQDYLISWSYRDGGTDTAAAAGKASPETVYTATINVPADPENGIRFADSESLQGICESGTVKSITRNDADGSVTIIIEFEKTGPKPSDDDVAAVIDMIRKLPEPPKITPEDKEAVEKARKAYDALTDEQKKEIPEDLVKKLNDAEKALADWAAYGKKVAAAGKIKVKLTSAAPGAYKKAVVKWKKCKTVTGYQIRYSTSKNFKKGVKKIKVKKARTVRKTLSKLTVGKVYYVQVRSFTKIRNQVTGKTRTVYGKWSNKKKFTEMQKVKLTSAAPGAYKKAVVKWKKCKAVTGYQIRYSTSKNFKKGVKKIKVRKAGTVRKTLTKLKVGKTYYVQVRTYKKMKKKTVYGKWSNKKKFTEMQKAKLTSAKAKKGKKAVIKWKKCKSVTGYQIRYSTSKNFKKGVKKITVRKAKTKRKTIRKLKAGKTYYVQVRTFKKINKKKTVYGKWSKTRKFKAKK